MAHRRWLGYLVPTGHRWINEFVGLLILTFAVLLALSLVSFNPDDPSLDISQNPRFAARPSNFVGVAGAIAADLSFQAWGYSAFVVPVFLGIYGFCWLASWPVHRLVVRVMGMALMVLTFSATFALLPAFPQVRGHIPPGGLVGTILSEKLEATLNGPGTAVVLVTGLLVSLLLATTFSFAWAAGFLKGRFSFISTISERWAEWKAERARAAEQPEARKEKTLKKQLIVTDKAKRFEQLPIVRAVEKPLERVRVESTPVGPVVAGSSARTSSAKALKSKSSTLTFNPTEFPSTTLLHTTTTT